MVYAQPKICPGEWDTQTSLGFWYTNRSPNLSQTTRPYNNQLKKKKRTSRIVDFAIPTDHWIKLRENEKKDKYLDLARESKKPWNMVVTVIPIVIGALGTFSKGLEDLGIGRRIEITSRLQPCWDRPEYWEETGRREETFCHSDYSKKRKEKQQRIFQAKNCAQEDLHMAKKGKPQERNGIFYSSTKQCQLYKSENWKYAKKWFV